MAANYLVTLPGPIALGPASPTPHLSWMVYNPMSPNGIAPGNQVPLQCDGAGNLLVNVAVGGGGGGGSSTVNQGTGGSSPWLVVGPSSTAANSPAATTVSSISSSILASNTNRKECVIVNTGTVVVYLGLGQVPTSSAYHIALSPCGTANDGTGGTYVSDIWKGAINAIVASTSGSVCVTELT